MTSTSPIYTIRVNGKISDSAESWGLSAQKNDQSHKDRHRLSGGTPAHRARWASLPEDSRATVLMHPDKV